jgi:hypothetical protein
MRDSGVRSHDWRTVPVQAYDIADAGGVWGGCGMNRPDGLCWDR